MLLDAELLVRPAQLRGQANAANQDVLRTSGMNMQIAVARESYFWWVLQAFVASLCFQQARASQGNP
jgi:hypothetical protein